MKKILILSLISVFTLGGLNSCISTKKVHVNANGKIPPGQMKKITGDKNAKKYAPGQNKNKDNR